MISDDLRTRQQTCLESFVLRARRVEAHSLAADLPQVLQWASHQMKLEGTADGRTWLVQRLPPEELLESAAARVRPLILQRDPIYYGKVLNAISSLIDPDQRANAARHLEHLRKSWKQVNPQSREIRAYTVQVTEIQTGESSDALTADRLAFAWIYGDSVHADPDRRAEAEVFGIDERYRAAAGIVAELILITIATLNLVRALQAAGLLTIPNAVLEQDVVVQRTEFRQEGEFYLGTPDAALPTEPGEPPGPDWQKLRGPTDIAPTPGVDDDHR